jgi:hypothetical protein
MDGTNFGYIGSFQLQNRFLQTVKLQGGADVNFPQTARSEIISRRELGCFVELSIPMESSVVDPVPDPNFRVERLSRTQAAYNSSVEMRARSSSPLDCAQSFPA